MKTIVALQILFTLAGVRAGVSQVANFPEPPLPDGVRDEIVIMLEAYYDALSDRDWDRFEQHFWSGATITALWASPDEAKPSVQVQSVAEFVSAAPEGPGSRAVFEERMTSAGVRVQGAMASVFTQYWARFGNPGDIAEWEGVDSFVLMKNNGQWRIVALTFVPGM